MDLKKLIAAVLRVEEEQITDDTCTKTLKAWNSTKHVELVMAVEKQFGIRFTTPEIISLQSVRQIEAILSTRGIQV